MKNYEFTSSKDIGSILQTLRVHGVCHLPDYLSNESLDGLNIEFEQILMSDSKSVFAKAAHPRNQEGKTARFSPWHDDSLTDFPLITRLFRDDFMHNIALQYYAPNVVEVNDEVFITNEKPSDIPILPWHFDRVQSLKFWFNLTDTTKENGAFEYCPGTHWEGHYRASYHMSQGVGVQDIPNDIDEALIRNPVTVELKAGDLLIFDPDGFHRGGVVQPGYERRVLRGHTHPKGFRGYGDRPFSAGWWLRSVFNLNKWTGHASKRILGNHVSDNTVNRKFTK